MSPALPGRGRRKAGKAPRRSRVGWFAEPPPCPRTASPRKRRSSGPFCWPSSGPAECRVFLDCACIVRVWHSVACKYCAVVCRYYAVSQSSRPGLSVRLSRLTPGMSRTGITRALVVAL